MPNYTYLLRCADGTLYCGWTNDPEKRLKAHNAGTASKYTASRRPVEMVWLEEHATKQEAMKREAAVKKMKRQQKLELLVVCPKCGAAFTGKTRDDTEFDEETELFEEDN